MKRVLVHHSLPQCPIPASPPPAVARLQSRQTIWPRGAPGPTATTAASSSAAAGPTPCPHCCNVSPVAQAAVQPKRRCSIASASRQIACAVVGVRSSPASSPGSGDGFTRKSWHARVFDLERAPDQFHRLRASKSRRRPSKKEGSVSTATCRRAASDAEALADKTVPWRRSQPRDKASGSRVPAAASSRVRGVALANRSATPASAGTSGNTAVTISGRILVQRQKALGKEDLAERAATAKPLRIAPCQSWIAANDRACVYSPGPLGRAGEVASRQAVRGGRRDQDQGRGSTGRPARAAATESAPRLPYAPTTTADPREGQSSQKEPLPGEDESSLLRPSEPETPFRSPAETGLALRE